MNAANGHQCIPFLGFSHSGTEDEDYGEICDAGDDWVVEADHRGGGGMELEVGYSQLGVEIVGE